MTIIFSTDSPSKLLKATLWWCRDIRDRRQEGRLGRNGPPSQPHAESVQHVASFPGFAAGFVVLIGIAGWLSTEICSSVFKFPPQQEGDIVVVKRERRYEEELVAMAPGRESRKLVFLARYGEAGHEPTRYRPSRCTLHAPIIRIEKQDGAQESSASSIGKT